MCAVYTLRNLATSCSFSSSFELLYYLSLLVASFGEAAVEEELKCDKYIRTYLMTKIIIQTCVAIKVKSCLINEN